MRECAEEVRKRLGIDEAQPQLRCQITGAFLDACETQVCAPPQLEVLLRGHHQLSLFLVPPRQGFSVAEGNLAATRAEAGAGYAGLNVNTMADGELRPHWISRPRIETTRNLNGPY
jgi:hypothetical protein